MLTLMFIIGSPQPLRKTAGMLYAFRRVCYAVWQRDVYPLKQDETQVAKRRKKMELYKGRPDKAEGRLPREIRTYDFLDELGVEPENEESVVSILTNITNGKGKVKEISKKLLTKRDL